MAKEIEQKSTMYLQRLTEQLQAQSLDLKVSDELVSVMGLSDFIAENLIRSPTLIENVTSALRQPDAQPDYVSLLAKETQNISHEPDLLKVLRQFRKQHMTCIAAVDLLNRQSIEQSLARVSALADALINQAYQSLYAQFCEKYGTPQGEHGPQPLLILGMGKLGGCELNFSSDIDLIFCYPTNGEIQGKRKTTEHRQFFTRLAQRLIHALDHIDQYGQVFRVDMRLRPLGDSGPLVMHLDAFEDYYQEQGREWERYAMIKARVLNDSSPYKDDLMDILRAFSYRRYVDYSAIESLRSMKSLITQEVRRRGLSDNVKLGPGGIREVEFIAQSFQIIKGGRETELQITGLIDTLQVLNELELLEDDDTALLVDSYLYLRKVEHCLQQFNDEQTQQLPQSELDQQRLVTVLQEDNYQKVIFRIEQHMSFIHEQFQMLIGKSPTEQDDQDSDDVELLKDVWQLELSSDEMEPLLTRLCSEQVAIELSSKVIEFKQIISKKRPTSRGLNALQILMPRLMQSVLDLSLDDNESEAPQLLTRLLNVLTPILLRTTYLQLLVENRGALQQLVQLCHASTWIAEHLSKYPILLDELLNPLHLYNPTALHEYHAELRQFMLRIDPEDLELQMESLRQFKQIQQLKIAAADVTGVLPVMQVSDHLSYLAEALIHESVNMAWHQMKMKYGVPNGTCEQNKSFAVIAYGKLGGLELGYSSDLDLVFLHDCASQSMTDGKKPLENNQFYIKFAQRIMHLFMTKTPSGQLYEVDMRLRPSGNAGLLVCHVDGFKQYQDDQAWTWEHQALVRTRVVESPPALRAKILDVRHQVIAQSRDIDTLKKDVVNMRQKMRDHLNRGDEQWLDMKQGTGAIADIEFLVQYWVLAYAKQYPELSKWSDNVRILEQLAKQQIISEQTQQYLSEAYLDYRNHSHRLTLLQKDNLVSKSQFLQHQEHVKQIWDETFA